MSNILVFTVLELYYFVFLKNLKNEMIKVGTSFCYLFPSGFFWLIVNFCWDLFPNEFGQMTFSSGFWIIFPIVYNFPDGLILFVSFYYVLLFLVFVEI
jgi:hypothetical protein